MRLETFLFFFLFCYLQVQVLCSRKQPDRDDCQKCVIEYSLFVLKTLSLARYQPFSTPSSLSNPINSKSHIFLPLLLPLLSLHNPTAPNHSPRNLTSIRPAQRKSSQNVESSPLPSNATNLPPKTSKLRKKPFKSSPPQ